MKGSRSLEDFLELKTWRSKYFEEPKSFDKLLKNFHKQQVEDFNKQQVEELRQATSQKLQQVTSRKFLNMKQA